MTQSPCVAQRIGTFAATLDLAGLGDAVLETARLSFVDTVGVMIAGAREPLARRAAAHAVATRGTGDCRLAALRCGASPLAAALANGVAAHVLDFDDTIYEGLAHPSAAILPAVLAAGDMAPATGADLMAGLVAGAETVAALGRAFTDGLYDRGVWTTPFLGTIASAAGAARVLRLDAGTAAHAIALAACQAFGSRAVMGTDAKPYLCGRAAEAGLESTLAAAAGITAPLRIVEDRSGIAQLFNGGGFDDAALAGLGSALARPVMGYKRFPVCSAAQAAAEAVQEIVRAHGVRARDVQAITCIVTPFVARCLPYAAARTRTEAMFSMHFALACTLVHGTIAPAHLADEIREGGEMRALMARIEMRVSEGLVPPAEAAGHLEAARVEIDTRDGAHLVHTVLAASAMPPNRPSRDLIGGKFLANVRAAAGDGAEAMLARLLAVERTASSRDVTGLIATAAAADALHR